MARRILSLWFPRLAVERMLRRRREVLALPFAVVADQGGAQVLVSLNLAAEAAGLRLGQPLRDGCAMCPGLLTAAADPARDAALLRSLRRWAGKFSPWVAEEPPEGLVLDLTGCAHLFGGEAGLLAEVEADCAALGFSLRAGLADTPGAAWALARHAGQAMATLRSGDTIAQEARATRSRAARRRVGAAPVPTAPGLPPAAIAAPGQTRQALAALPLAALRLPPETVAGLARLGLRQVADIMGLPRAALARRFGAATLRRLDQALGLEPEPITPARLSPHFVARLTFPDPIGLLADVEAGVERLLAALCLRLRAQGRGTRWLRLQAFRSDGQTLAVEVGLARPADDPVAIRPLLALKLDQIDAGFGIDCLRLEATATEPMIARQHAGHLEAAEAAVARQTSDTALDDLVGKLGARLGIEAVTRLHPAESHIPEKSLLVLAAAFSAPSPDPWPAPRAPRPLILFRPELLGTAEASPHLPPRFCWRRQDCVVARALGPERIAPEWWLDNPEWRSGVRDYWRVELAGGTRLWLFHAHGGAISGGWFCQGQFA